MALTKVPGVMLIGQGLANIQDYGAHSVTEPGYTAFDSTAAIQQAINSGNPVYVPPGVYEISATLTLPQDATILGSVNVNPVDPGAQTVPLRIPTFAKYTSVIQYKVWAAWCYLFTKCGTAVKHLHLWHMPAVPRCSNHRLWY